MRKFLSRFPLISVLLIGLAPFCACAQDLADNAWITQDYPDGAGGTNQVPTHVVFNSNQAGNDFYVTGTGKVSVHSFTSGNLTSSVVLVANTTSLTTATPKTITSLTLGVGTWRIYGYVDYVLASASTTLFQQGFATTTNSFTNSLQVQDTSLNSANALTTTSTTLTGATPFNQVVVSTGTQQIFLVAEATFSAGTVTGYGSMYAIQVR